MLALVMGAPRYIGELNLETYELTPVYETEESNVITFTMGRDGKAYAIARTTGDLLEINLETGEVTTIMQTGVSADYTQSMTFDHTSGLLYWAASSTYDESLYEINVTARTMRVINKDLGKIAGLHMIFDLEGDAPVTGVTLNKTETTLNLGDSEILTATVMPFNASDVRVTWETSNSNVVTVDRGAIKAVGLGTAVITVRTVDGDYTAECNVTVAGEYLFVEDFEDELEGWTLVDADSDGRNWISMQSFDSSIPAYEGNNMYTSQSAVMNPVLGLETPLDPDNWLISPEFTVSDSAETILLSWIAGSQNTQYREHYSVYVGFGDPIPENFTDRIYEGYAENAEMIVAEISAEYAGQNVRVAFRHHESRDRYMLNLDYVQFVQAEGDEDPGVIPVTGIELNKTELTMLVHEEETLIATVSPSNATIQTVTWSTSNDMVASVVDGRIVAKMEGVAQIRATTTNGGYVAVCQLTVTEGDLLLNEDFDSVPSDWTMIDADGDGRNWMLMSEYSAEVWAYEGADMFTSQSYSNFEGPLNPDNWLISPEFTIANNFDRVVLSWMAGSQVAYYPDHYTVYIGTGDAVPETFTTVLYDGVATDVETLTVDLRDYAGQTVRIAFRHHDSSNCFMLNIDAVKVAQLLNEESVVHVDGISLDRTSISIPEGGTDTLIATITPENADDKRVTWTSSNQSVATVLGGVVTAVSEGTAIITVTTVDGNFSATCEVTVISGEVVLYEDFEDYPSEWTLIDSDGDGYNWMSLKEFSPDLTAYVGNDQFVSFSYLSGVGGLDPDNWLISPEFTIDDNATSAMLSWIAGSHFPAYPDTYTVYIGQGSAVPENFTTVLFSETANDRADRTVDLSAYGGQTVRIAFRHHNSNDCYMIKIDEIKVMQTVGSDAVPVTGIELDTTSADMIIGEALTLNATISPANATNKNVRWTSSNNAVATVENGVVRAIASGTVIITATSANGGFSATCEVRVRSIEEAGGDYVLYEDFEDELEGWTILDEDGDGRSWLSLRSFGLDGLEGYDSFTSQSYANNAGAFNPDNWLISPEFTIDADATAAFLTWLAASQDTNFPDHYTVYIGSGEPVPETFTDVLYSGNPTTVLEQSVNLMDYAGQTVRIAFRHHNSYDCYMINIDLIRVQVTTETPGPGPVIIPATGVTLNRESAEMVVGGEMILVPTVEPANATNREVTWASSNNAVATVENGVVTAVAPGTAIITVTTVDGGFTATCTVTVVEDTPETIPVTGVTLDATSAELTVGGTLTLNATVSPENATNKNVVWTTSNEAVATVADGVVTAISAGEAVITVTTVDGAFTATCTIRVADPTVPVTGITLDVESAVMIIGGQLTINATVMPEDATNKNIVWTTSDEAVATVENGVVTAIAYGEVTITATTEDGAFTATCTIKVYEAGDVTGDGMFNTGDAVAMLRKIAGLDNSTYVAELEDYNGDGMFNTGDAVAILRKIAGLA